MSTFATEALPPTAHRRRSRVGAFAQLTRRGAATRLMRLGDFAIFTVRTILSLPAVLSFKTRRHELIAQLDALGVGALPITEVTGFIAGLLLGMQTRVSLREFGITTLFPQMLTLALVREVGPTFVALVVGARAASGVTSELATMSVTQQVDALRALRRDPVSALSAPRTLACVIAFPALAISGILAGMFGGMLVATSLQQTPSFFFHQGILMLSLREIIPNLVVKPAVFGLLVGIIAAYLGLRTEGGTRAVGGATVRSVVIVTVGVLVADYIVTEIFRQVWPPPPF